MFAGIDSTMSTDCPRCGFVAAEGAGECRRCGVVFRKLERSADTRRRPTARVRPVPERWIEREGARALGAGFALAAVVALIPFLSFVFSYLTTLVHELGHASLGWAFGYPSVPAFDFVYGGGVTSHEERKLPLLILVYAAFAAGLWRLRSQPAALSVLGSVIVVYSICAWTAIHDVIIVAMGHGAELVFAGIFFYRALSGAAVKVPVERPLYAFLGFFIVIEDARFAHGLLTSPEKRAIYEGAKGGGHWMDFSVLAEQYLRTDLTSVAGSFLLCCFLPLLAAVLFLRFRSPILGGLVRLLQAESSPAS
jgi:hypothetical protein